MEKGKQGGKGEQRGKGEREKSKTLVLKYSAKPIICHSLQCYHCLFEFEPDLRAVPPNGASCLSAAVVRPTSYPPAR